MNSFFSVFLDKNSQKPIYQQLGDALLQLITDGTIPPDSKLPPIRKMSKSLKINNSTVVNAYKYLLSKQAVYSVTGSGTYTSPIKANTVVNLEQERVVTLDDINCKINLSKATAGEDFFPTEEFRQAINYVLDKEGGNSMKGVNPFGYEPLIESVCYDVLGKEINFSSHKENIFITKGIYQLLFQISDALIKPGEYVLTEKPCNPYITGAFLKKGAKTVGISLTDEGIDILELEKYAKVFKPKLLYISPYFQTPTGISQSNFCKRKLIELASKYGFLILEDDSFSDFNYSCGSIVTLKSLDYKNVVIYYKNLTNMLLPGLNLGVCVVPPRLKKLMESWISEHISNDLGIIQKVVDLMIRDGSYAEHKYNIFNILENRYKTLISCWNKNLKSELLLNPPKGGTGIWAKVQGGREVIDKLHNNLLEKGVLISPGYLYNLNDEEFNDYIRISFANANEKEIEKGLNLIKEFFNSNV